VLLDSLTRLGRSFNVGGVNSGRTMSGGIDARALEFPSDYSAPPASSRKAAA